MYLIGLKKPEDEILDPARRSPGHPSGGRILQPIDKWEICLHKRYPAYIAWDEFVANQAQLCANSLKYREEQPEVARKGQALTLKGSCAVGDAQPYSTCTIRASRANGPSIGVVPTRASKASNGNARLARARDLAKRAERQYQAVEPENRLVARELPKQWEEQLRAVETVEKEDQVWKSSRFGIVTQADREAIVALGSDLPARLPSAHDPQ